MNMELSFIPLTLKMMVAMIMTVSSNKLTPPLLCVKLIILTIMACVIMSSKFKMSMISMITMLTISGGLMIMFLYLTATQAESKLKKKSIFPKLITIMLPMFPSIPLMNLSIKNMDPSQILFEPSCTQLTLMSMTSLMLLLIMTVKTCSKIKKPIRREAKIKISN